MKRLRLLVPTVLACSIWIRPARADDVYVQNLRETARGGLDQVAEAVQFHAICVAIGFLLLALGIAVSGYFIGKGVARKGSP